MQRLLCKKIWFYAIKAQKEQDKPAQIQCKESQQQVLVAL